MTIYIIWERSEEFANPRILSCEGFFFFEKYVEVSTSSFIKKIDMQYET